MQLNVNVELEWKLEQIGALRIYSSKKYLNNKIRREAYIGSSYDLILNAKKELLNIQRHLLLDCCMLQHSPLSYIKPTINIS